MSRAKTMAENKIIGFPRLRGDEPDVDYLGRPTELVFPAYAGMSPDEHKDRRRSHRFPRLRGDEPRVGVGVEVDDAFSPPTRG